jgi:hypothetical protein
VTACPDETPDDRHVGHWDRAAGAAVQGLIDIHDLVATLDRVVGRQ